MVCIILPHAGFPVKQTAKNKGKLPSLRQPVFSAPPMSEGVVSGCVLCYYGAVVGRTDAL
jgi:hypothetical protein